jgi:short-subunit dehydrogenase
MKLADRLVLITGASSGIGKAAAKKFAQSGSRLVLLARRVELMDQTRDQIVEMGGEAHIYQCDLSHQQQVAKVCTQIRDDLGVPDVIVNNAGAGRFLSVEETAPNDVVSMMAVPYFGAFWLTQQFVSQMIERGSGFIINITSPASRIPWPGATAYTVARWAMRGFSEALRADLFATGVKSGCVILGKTSSDYFNTNRDSEERLPRVARLIPTLSPEQAAKAIVRCVEREKRLVVVPLTLRLFFAVHTLVPAPVEWLVKRTGWKRADTDSAS